MRRVCQHVLCCAACAARRHAVTVVQKKLTSCQKHVMPQLHIACVWQLICRSVRGAEILLDIEDYLRTPTFFPDFQEKFLIIATNARQLMEWYRKHAEEAQETPEGT